MTSCKLVFHLISSYLRLLGVYSAPLFYVVLNIIFKHKEKAETFSYYFVQTPSQKLNNTVSVISLDFFPLFNSNVSILFQNKVLQFAWIALETSF